MTVRRLSCPLDEVRVPFWGVGEGDRKSRAYTESEGPGRFRSSLDFRSRSVLVFWESRFLTVNNLGTRTGVGILRDPYPTPLSDTPVPETETESDDGTTS